MKLLGAHLSISKGIHTVEDQMDKLNIKSCAVFLKNQRRYDFKEITEQSIKLFKAKIKNPEYMLPHGSYLINMANPELFDKSMPVVLDDLIRCSKLGIKYYNMHPGADIKKLGAKSFSIVSDFINILHSKVDDVVILLENMAGQGTTLGRSFEDLKTIIEKVNDKKRIGVTLDTCHLFGSGYDITTKEKFEIVMKEFDEKIGIKYLKAMHLNDSAKPLGSHRDLHAHIGKGLIGLEAFEFIMNDSRFDDMPLVLETPDPELFHEDLKILRSLVKKE